MKTLKKMLCILLCTIMLVSVIPAGAINVSHSDNSVSASQNSAKKLDPVKVGINFVKFLIDKMIYFLRVIINLLRQLLGWDNQITVSFETQGGSKIRPVKITKGGTLSVVPTPVKNNYAFTGWYTDEALTINFYSDSAINSNMTLYASYIEKDNEFKEFEDPTKYIEDCDPNISFSFISPVSLTTSNFADYVELSAYIGDIPTLNISANGGVYTVTPATPFTAGGHYKFVIKNDSITFSGESEAVREFTFRIYKDEVFNVELQDGIIYVLWADVADLGEGAYSVPPSLYTIVSGDTVCFWDGEMNELSRFCKILLATQVAGDGVNEAITVLYTEESALKDVFDEVDISFKDSIPVSEYMDSIDTDKIAEDVKNSEGTQQITEILARALNLSPSVNAMTTGAASQDSGFIPVHENNDKLSITVNALVQGLTITASVGSAVNENFPKAGSDDWVVLGILFTFKAVIQQKVEIIATFEVKEFVKTSTQGEKKWENGKLIFDFALDMYSQTQITLSVLIKSKDASDTTYINITSEIEKLTNDKSDDDVEIAPILTEVLGAKGDDIELVNISLFTTRIALIPAFPIFQLMIDLNFVVKVNFAAGISAGLTTMSAKQVGICGGKGDGLSSYSSSLEGNDRFIFDFYAAGYLGVKAGLNMSISLSFFGLERLGKVGVSGEVGAYLDLYGFLHVNISKTTPGVKATTSLQGGLYMEVGIYLEINIFAESEVFKAKAEFTAYEHKWPLFTMGNRYVLLKFKDSESTFIMNSDSYDIKNTPGLFDAVYIDLTNGQQVTGNYSDIEDFTMSFSSQYLGYYNVNAQIIYVKKNVLPETTKRIDSTVYIYYTGNNLMFSRTENGYAVKTVNMVWLDSTLNPALLLNTFKATYVLDIDGTRTTIAEKDVIYGQIPGGINFSDHTRYGKVTEYINDYNQPITQDTVYTVKIVSYQKLVSFITYYGDAWHLDVYAVNLGSMPLIPAGYDSTQPAKIFRMWSGQSGNCSKMPPVYEVVSADYDIRTKGMNFTYTGLDTTQPLYSFTGTEDECRIAYNQDRFVLDNATYSAACLYLYLARYTDVTYNVTFIFPAMTYPAFGFDNTYTFEEINYDQRFGYGEKIFPRLMLTGYGCVVLGWDVDGDGTIDYGVNDLPLATGDMTVTAISSEVKKQTVTVLDKDGNLSETLTINKSTLPNILLTSPDYNDSSGAIYKFKNWLVSIDGGDFTTWSFKSNHWVVDDWRIMPYYDEFYTVTIDYNGGLLAGDTSRIMQLPKGTYNSATLLSAPVKADSVYYHYEFAGWDCGETLNVNSNVTITAQYTETLIQYTAEFNTSTGVLANGQSSASFTGDYDSYLAYIADFLADNTPLATVYTADKVYTFARWAGYSSGTGIRYDAQWDAAVRNYTVTFNSGEGTFNGGTSTFYNYDYGSTAGFTAEYINTAAKAADVYTTFKLSGWRDQTGTIYPLDGTYTVTGDMTFTAVYEADQRILYTVTMNAGIGKFDDDTVIKQFSGYYGDATNIIVENPVCETNYANLYYVFAGWSQPIPAVFTENTSIVAQFDTVYYEFTITFDAGDGKFASNNSSVLTQTYHHGDTIDLTEVPIKAEEEFFTYAFKSWSPALSTVTGDRTYTATYLATRKDTSLPATGIYVSDGLSIEDINCNVITGYTYELVEVPYNDGVFVPTLTVTGDGLTFSGSGSEVYFIVADGVNDVTFNNITLTGSTVFANGNLVLEDSESTVPTTVYFSGDCSFNYTQAVNNSVRCERSVAFEGTDSLASLTISVFNSWAIYCAMGIEFNDLNLTVNIATTEEYYFVSAFSGETMTESAWHFNNSTVTVISGGCCFSSYAVEISDSIFNVDCKGTLGEIYGDFAIVNSDITASGAGGFRVFGGDMSIEGDSTIDIESTNKEIPAVDVAYTYYEIWGYNEGTDEYEPTGVFFEAGYLNFIDFTGTFDAYFADETAPGPAVKAGVGISFTIDGIDALDAYDLDGAQITLLTDADANDYYTFTLLSADVFIPDAFVSVAPVTVGKKSTHQHGGQSADSQKNNT